MREHVGQIQAECQNIGLGTKSEVITTQTDKSEAASAESAMHRNLHARITAKYANDVFRRWIIIVLGQAIASRILLSLIS